MLISFSAWRAEGCLIPKHLVMAGSSNLFVSPSQAHLRNKYKGSTLTTNHAGVFRNTSPKRSYWSKIGSDQASGKQGNYRAKQDTNESLRIERSSLNSALQRRCDKSLPPQWTKQKPRSWDNLLATKSFNGYGLMVPIKDGANADRLRSFSSYQLKKDDTYEKGWNESGCKTMPRSKIKQRHKSTETLVSPLSSSFSCFSCDCLSINSHPLETCLFLKPKSSESLLAPKALTTAPSDTSLVGRDDRNKRRSRTASLVDCLGGGKEDEISHV